MLLTNGTVVDVDGERGADVRIGPDGRIAAVSTVGAPRQHRGRGVVGQGGQGFVSGGGLSDIHAADQPLVQVDKLSTCLVNSL